jgi:sporulation protein YlmC with PRC-barrel domain
MTQYIFAALIALTLATPAATQPQVSGQTNPWSVSKVIGVTVYDPQSEEIGQIVDLIMDPHAIVTSIIVSVGAYLGTGERMVAVPLEVIRFPNTPTTTGSLSSERKWAPDRAVLDTTKDILLGMPPFNY